MEALRDNLARNRRLKVSVLLDYCRGNRAEGKENKSSCTMVEPLVRYGEDRCRVSLYHTPALRGLRKLAYPQKLNETVGLQHCKVFVFDDSVLVSGANLSADYFGQRQDRYVLFRDCPRLADYFDGLVSEDKVA